MGDENAAFLEDSVSQVLGHRIVRAGRATGYLKKGPEPVGAWPGIHVECPPAVQPPNPG